MERVWIRTKQMSAADGVQGTPDEAAAELRHAHMRKRATERRRMDEEARPLIEAAVKAAEIACDAVDHDRRDILRCPRPAGTAAAALLREVAAYDVAEARHAELRASIKVQQISASVWEELAEELDCIALLYGYPAEEMADG